MYDFIINLYHPFSLFIYYTSLFFHLCQTDIPKISAVFITKVSGGAQPTKMFCSISEDFPGGSDGKASTYNAGDPGSSPGWGRSSGEGNGNPLQYSCLENPTDGGAW